MPRIKSAKKRMRQTAAATARNRTQRSQLRSTVKKVRTAPGAEAGNYVYPGDLAGYDPYLADQLQSRYGIPTAPPVPTDPVASLAPFLIAPIFTIQ